MLLISARCRQAQQNKTNTFPKARSPLPAEFNNTRSICVCSTPPTENEMLIFSDNKYLQYYLGQVISNPNPKVNKGRNHFVNLNFVISDLLLLYFWGLRAQAVQDWLVKERRKMQRKWSRRDREQEIIKQKVRFLISVVYLFSTIQCLKKDDQFHDLKIKMVWCM